MRDKTKEEIIKRIKDVTEKSRIWNERKHPEDAHMSTHRYDLKTIIDCINGKSGIPSTYKSGLNGLFDGGQLIMPMHERNIIVDDLIALNDPYINEELVKSAQATNYAHGGENYRARILEKLLNTPSKEKIYVLMSEGSTRKRLEMMHSDNEEVREFAIQSYIDMHRMGGGHYLEDTDFELQKAYRDQKDTLFLEVLARLEECGAGFEYLIDSYSTSVVIKEKYKNIDKAPVHEQKAIRGLRGPEDFDRVYRKEVDEARDEFMVEFEKYKTERQPSIMSSQKMEADCEEVGMDGRFGLFS